MHCVSIKTYLYQVQSYNDFITYGIPMIISECRPITWFNRTTGDVGMSIKFIKCVVTRPKHEKYEHLLPRTCRQLGISYNGQLVVHLRVSGPDFEEFDVPDVILGVLCCVLAKMCYFSKKIVMGQNTTATGLTCATSGKNRDGPKHHCHRLNVCHFWKKS